MEGDERSLGGAGRGENAEELTCKDDGTPEVIGEDVEVCSHGTLVNQGGEEDEEDEVRVDVRPQGQRSAIMVRASTGGLTQLSTWSRAPSSPRRCLGGSSMLAPPSCLPAPIERPSKEL